MSLLDTRIAAGTVSPPPFFWAAAKLQFDLAVDAEQPQDVEVESIVVSIAQAAAVEEEEDQEGNEASDTFTVSMNLSNGLTPCPSTSTSTSMVATVIEYISQAVRFDVSSNVCKED